jgi:hypothetical protein
MQRGELRSISRDPAKRIFVIGNSLKRSVVF